MSVASFEGIVISCFSLYFGYKTLLTFDTGANAELTMSAELRILYSFLFGISVVIKGFTFIISFVSAPTLRAIADPCE